MFIAALLSLGILALILLLAPGHCRPGELEALDIINMHVHVAGIGADSDCFITPELLNKQSLGFRPTASPARHNS